MAKMCPLDGCKAQKGLCIHDKMMIGMGVLALFFAVGRFGLGLF